MKRSLGISRRNTGRAIKKFLSSFGQESEYIERDIGCARLKKKWSANEKNRTPQEMTAKQSKRRFKNLNE